MTASTPSRKPSGTETGDRPLDAAQALAALLPAALLLWPGPGALLRDVPTTASTAAGFAALASLPAALLLIVRRADARARALLPLLVVIAVAEIGGRTVAGDTFEARRALLSLWTALMLFVSGASLGARGAATLAAGLAALALVATLPALTFDGPAGILGNTGDLSEAALPGALAGIGVFLARRGPLSVLGGAATLSYAFYAGWVPVRAGAVSFACAAAVALVLSLGISAASARGATLARQARLGLVAVLVLVLPFGWRAATSTEAAAAVEPSDGQATEEIEVDPAAADGGVEFRVRTARRLPRLVLDHAWLGVGPGQFTRAFPPYRDPAEIELSSHQRREPTPIEVEHAHDDWLQGFAEYGLIGGGAWVLFLVLVGARALRALLSGDATRAALGLAALAVLANALANAPLLYGVASPLLAFPLFGALCARDRPRAPGGATAPRSTLALLLPLLLPLLPVLALVLRAGASLDFVRHGAALGRLAQITVETSGGTKLRASRLGPILADALEACPDSVPVLARRAGLEQARGRGGAERNLREQLVDLRPFSFEHLVGLANRNARDGRYPEARALYDRAEAVDAAHPELPWNRLKLALDSGDLDGLVDGLATVDERGTLDVAWLEKSGAEQLLKGRPGMAHLILSRVDPRYQVQDANVSYQLAQESRKAGEELLADAFLSNAHFLFARGHVADGKPEAAVRSYRQSIRFSRGYPGLENGAPLVRLELAAALVRAGKVDDAGAVLEGLEPSPTHLRELPEWAGQELLDAGLLFR